MLAWPILVLSTGLRSAKLSRVEGAEPPLAATSGTFAETGASDRQGLALADSVHLGAADGAGALSGGAAVLQRHLRRVPHLPLGAAL